MVEPGRINFFPEEAPIWHFVSIKTVTIAPTYGTILIAADQIHF